MESNLGLDVQHENRPAQLPDIVVTINGRAYVPQYREDPKYFCVGCALAPPALGGNDDCCHPDANTVQCWVDDPETGRYNFQFREVDHDTQS